ncbi:MAG: hypothetical protein HYX67_02105 [Candidatus Melainabacteria bacterium]|nr:hypothetical protein [Candidatus Melainabacteria bacterium]
MCTLSQLLPYDPMLKKNGDLKTGIKEYTLLLSLTENALLAVQGGNLKAFDANVGDDACEIRAAKIALTAGKCWNNAPKIAGDVQHSKKRMEGLHQPYRFFNEKGNSPSRIVT